MGAEPTGAARLAQHHLSASTRVLFGVLCLACALNSACQPGTDAVLSLAPLHFEVVDAPISASDGHQALLSFFERQSEVRLARMPRSAAQRAASLGIVHVTVARRHPRIEQPCAATHVPYVVRVRLSVRTARPLSTGYEPGERFEASEPLSEVAGPAGRAALDDALEAAWRRVRQKRDLVRAGPEAWLATLSAVPTSFPSADTSWHALAAYEQAGLAIDCVAAARTPQAVQPLLTLVNHGADADDAVSPMQIALSRRAVGALAAIGDRAAVLPLIDAAQRRLPDQVAQLAYAVGALGGRTAQGWLVTLATGHEDAMVRDAASVALTDNFTAAQR